MNYTAKQIDRMEIEELEQLANYLSHAQQLEWAEYGYSGAKFFELTKNGQ